MGVAAKQLITLFTFVLIVFIVFEWLNIKDESQRIKSKFESEAQQAIDKTNQLLYNYQENIKQVLLILSKQHNILSQENDEEIKKYLQEYCENTPYLIKNYYIKKQDGRIISNNQIFLDIIGRAKLDEIVNIVKANTAGISWTEPYHSPISFNTIAFAVPYREKGSFEVTSTILAEINMDYIETLIRPGNFLNAKTMVVLTASGRPVVYDKNSILLPLIMKNGTEEIDSVFLDILCNLNNGMDTVTYGGKKMYAIKDSGKALGYALIVLADQRLVDNDIKKLYQSILATLATMLAVLFGVIYITTYYFTRPITKMAARMDRVMDIEKFIPFQTSRRDEVGILAGSYNSMMERIRELAREIREAESKKKEYELKMLQSQIGPHFLFNTLACIGSLANQYRVEEVRETIRDLVNLLTFSFDKTSEFVTLEEELDGLESYVRIQKVRYGGMFEYRATVPEEAYECKIPRLLLQPLVENSIFHGIKPKKENGIGIVDIKCIMKDGYLLIKVRDNGIGMEKGKVESLLNGSAEKKDGGRFNSIGLMNVYERIRLYYGDGQEFRFLSRKGRGTVIIIKLDCKKL